VGKKCGRLISEMLDHSGFNITFDVEEISKHSHHSCKCHYLTKGPSHGGMIIVYNAEKMQKSRSTLALSLVRQF
jgi:hypothetical protein